jgi:microcystin-dependent protein
MRTAVEGGLLPVGTIMAYAGALPNFEDQGWLACDGRPLLRERYKELWEAIGTAYGAPSDQEFNAPALEGMFLRGVVHDSTRDPSAKDRTPLRPGGNAGAQVGSLQPYGTATPGNPFEVTLENYDVSETRYDKGLAARPYKWSSADTVCSAGGGDKESRPINKYVYFIIKAASRTVTGRVVQPPVGSVMPFASEKNPDPTRWALCDGSRQPTNGEWELLFGAIQFAHGESDQGEMVLPDYRGYFLRGVSGQSNVDPDADERTAPYTEGQDGKKGNAGNQVGSEQSFATGAPTSVPFSTTFRSLPKDKADSDGIAGWVRYLVDSKGAKTVSLSASGGDPETRPWNLAIDWYIRARN